MKANGCTIKPMVLEYTLIIMVQYMKGTGSITSSKVKGFNSGLMAVNMKESSRMARNMAKESTFGPIEATTQGPGQTTNSAATGSINGLKEKNIKANGSEIRCMGKGYTPGRMGEGTKAATTMTRSTVMGSTTGRMEECLRGSGSMESGKAKASTWISWERLKWEFGDRIRE